MTDAEHLRRVLELHRELVMTRYYVQGQGGEVEDLDIRIQEMQELIAEVLDA